MSVDGRPLLPSAPVPVRAFTLRWSMDDCVILNGSTSLTGDVEMLAFHDGDRYTASVWSNDLMCGRTRRCSGEPTLFDLATVGAVDPP